MKIIILYVQNGENMEFQEHKKKRGRPKGSKNTTSKKSLVRHTELSTPKAGSYTFRSVGNLCDCVYYSSVMGSAMFCIHKHAMSARDNQHL